MSKALSLGDVRAEQDQAMLNVAFYESPDYRTLIESDAKALVVGRRGTGKSALFWKLAEYYASDEKTDVIKVAPDEHDTLALRPLADELGGSFTLIRATLRLIFRYALMMEIASAFSNALQVSEVQPRSSAAGIPPRMALQGDLFWPYQSVHTACDGCGGESGGARWRCRRSFADHADRRSRQRGVEGYKSSLHRPHRSHR